MSANKFKVKLGDIVELEILDHYTSQNFRMDSGVCCLTVFGKVAKITDAYIYIVTILGDNEDLNPNTEFFGALKSAITKVSILHRNKDNDKE